MWRALAFGRTGLSVCISMNLRSASEILKKCVMFAEAVKMLSKGALTYTASFDKIVFSNGARVMSLPGGNDGSSVRGWTIRGALVLDEAAFFPHLERLMAAVAPTLTTSPDAELVISSTPSGKNHPFYKMWCNALDSDDWFASLITIEDAIKQGLDVDIEHLHQLCPDPIVFDQEYRC